MFTLDSWSADDYDNLTEYLKSNADLKYRDFHSSLVPDTESNSIIGIRMPIMRKIAKKKFQKAMHGNFLIFLKQNIMSSVLSPPLLWD